MRSRGKLKKRNICNSLKHKATKYGSLLTYGLGNPLTMKSHDHRIIESHDSVRSREKNEKTLYLNFCKIYGHQTWPFGDLGKRNTPMKSNDHMIL